MSLKIDVLCLTEGDRDNFSSQLMLLYQKADLVNKAKIKMMWPNLVTVFEAWNQGPPVGFGNSNEETEHIPDLPYDGPISWNKR